MRILLTGGTGMVGRNLLEHPGTRDHEVLAPTRQELDLASRDSVSTYLERERPDLVIHAAGRVGGIQANLADPAGFFLENLEMGRNVVWGAFQAGVPRLLNLSSSCVYPREAPNPLREDAILTGPLEPTNEGYALAKIATMKLCQYVTAKDPAFQYRTLIPCNLYGPHDHFGPDKSHLVASIVRKVHEAREQGSDTVEIWGDGTARREFMYAGDLADCILHAVARYDSLPPVMNVGPGIDHTVDEYYVAVADAVGWHGRFIHDTARPVGMPQKLVDTTRLRAWGWTPTTSLSEGLALTYQYYLSRFATTEATP